jgi:phosphoribosylamine-glycine ligase
MKVLIVGAGASCEVVAKKLQESDLTTEIFCWPRASPANSKVESFHLGEYATTTELANAADRENINLVVLASADAVQSGLANVLEIYRIPCFGPTRIASHFQWDRECLRQCLESCNAKLINSDEAILDGGHDKTLNWGIKTNYLAFVHGLRSQSIGLVKEASDERLVRVDAPHYMESIERDIIDPLLKRLFVENSPYSGFLTMEVIIVGDKLHIGSTNFTEDIGFLETILATDQRDWLSLIKEIMGLNERLPRSGQPVRAFGKASFC